MALSINEIAPDFSLPSVNDNTFSLSKDMANKPCVLYFYPKNFTAVCSAEACEFRDHFAEFRNLEVAVIGISQDSVESHKKFKKAYDLPFDLLADEKEEVAELYKVKNTGFTGLFGMKSRITYLLSKDHKVLAAYDGIFAKGHVESMLEALKKVQDGATV